jgi:hypothetical protein
VQLELMVAFKEEFLLLETQLSTVEQCLHQNNSLLLAHTPEDMAKYAALTQNISPHEDAANIDLSLDFLQKLALGISTPVLLPVAVGLIIGAPIFLLWDLKKWRRRSQSLKNLSSYIEDPVGFVTKRAHSFLDKVAQTENVAEYVFAQLEPAREYLEQMKKAIPSLIESNQKLMDSIANDRRNSREIEEKYGEVKHVIAAQQEALAAFGNRHVRRYDCKAEDVEVIKMEGGLPGNRRCTGIWTETQLCELKKTKATVTCKVYLDRYDGSALHLTMEEQLFR